VLYNSNMPEWIGKTVGKVRIEKALAQGGMAEVYLGTHLTLDRLVAVKVMHNYIESDPELQSRFEREAKVVAALRHSNIVQILDFDTADGHPYIVMEYLKGPTLATYLRDLFRRNERLQPTQVARLLVALAAALDYAHEQGVIHRDIKPGNIILHNKAREISTHDPLTCHYRFWPGAHCTCIHPDCLRHGEWHTGIHVTGAGAGFAGGSSQ
jgi:serine/threonine protein kinase